MDKLVKKIIMSEVNPYWKIEGVSDEFYVTNSEEASFEQLQVVQEALKKLYEYEQMEEQGLLLKLPCKIGTNKLYYIDDDKEIYRINGDEVSIKRFPSGQIIYDYDCCEFSYEDFGKTVFLTKEEAEQELKRLEDIE